MTLDEAFAVRAKMDALRAEIAFLRREFLEWTGSEAPPYATTSDTPQPAPPTPETDA